MKPYVAVVLLTAFAALAYSDSREACRKLGRGINLGNALEAPTEGSWGVVLDSSYFSLIKSKGFNSVRIPVRWSTQARTSETSPYTVNEQFFSRVDWAIHSALQRGLCAVVNVHHYDSLFARPQTEWNRFVAIWGQISRRYKTLPDSVAFEILNEPNTNLTADLWNTLLAQTLDTIRATNPTRPVVIGTAEWGGIDGLRKLKLPTDPNLILTVHYYQPFQFTHQGADWVSGSTPWLGTTWEATYFEKLAVNNDLEFVRWYSTTHGIPVYVGEFGAYSKADMASRVRWTSYCARLFEKYGFSWSYWEFCSGFGIYDAQKKTWNTGLVDALISSDTGVLRLEPESLGANVLVNGDFSNGKTGWTFGAWEGAATGTVVDGAFKAMITTPGQEMWNIQLLQSGIRLVKGDRYALVFDVWADSVRTIGAAVESAVTYKGYGSLWGTMVTTEPRTLATVFTMTVADSSARVSFSVGAQAASVYLDNIRLVNLSKPAGTVVRAKAGAAKGGRSPGGALDLTGRRLPKAGPQKADPAGGAGVVLDNEGRPGLSGSATGR